MASWQHWKLMKCKVDDTVIDEMKRWVDEMASLWNDDKKWQDDEMKS